MDEKKKKKMLMIGGVVALAVVVIIAAAVMMNHKKKVDQSPTVNRGGSGRQLSTLATAGTTTIPAPTVPIQKKYYIQSTGGLYLICEFGKILANTTDVNKATPVTFTNCSPTGGSNENCLMVNNQNVKINPGGGIATGGTYTIYIHSLTETTYLGLLGVNAYLDVASMGFGAMSIPNASIWKVVSM